VSISTGASQTLKRILQEAAKDAEEIIFPLITSLRQGSGWQARMGSPDQNHESRSRMLPANWRE
jgi:hypothetical protein